MGDSSQPHTDQPPQSQDTTDTGSSPGTNDRPDLPTPSQPSDQPGAGQSQTARPTDAADRPNLDHPGASAPGAPSVEQPGTMGDTTTNGGRSDHGPEPIVTSLPPETGQGPAEPAAGPEPIVKPLPPETGNDKGDAPPAPEPVVTPLPAETGAADGDRSRQTQPQPKSDADPGSKSGGDQPNPRPDQPSYPRLEHDVMPREIASVTHPSGGPMIEFDQPVTKEEAASVLFPDGVPDGVDLRSSSEDSERTTHWQVTGLNNHNVTELNGAMSSLVASHSTYGPTVESPSTGSEQGDADRGEQAKPDADRGEQAKPDADRGEQAKPEAGGQGSRLRTMPEGSPTGKIGIRHPDGAAQERAPDGANTFTSPGRSTVTLHPDGSVVASPDVQLRVTPDGDLEATTRDGYMVIASPKGDMSVTSPDGSTGGLGRDGTISASDGEGWSVVYSADGTRSTTTVAGPDGTIVARSTDGTTTIGSPDGTEMTFNPDGTVVQTDPGRGNVRVWEPDGTFRLISPDGTTTRIEPDGDMYYEYPDGTFHGPVMSEPGLESIDPAAEVGIGALEGVRDLGVSLWSVAPIRALIDSDGYKQTMADLWNGLQHTINDPIGTAKAIANDALRDGPLRAIGRLAPDMAIGAATGGAGIVATKVDDVARAATKLDDLAGAATKVDDAATKIDGATTTAAKLDDIAGSPDSAKGVDQPDNASGTAKTGGAVTSATDVPVSGQRQTPNGGVVFDEGRAGRRADDPQPGVQQRYHTTPDGRVVPSFDWSDTNIQRMLDGKAPVGADGKPMELHHRGQSPHILDEYTHTLHKSQHQSLHDNDISRHDARPGGRSSPDPFPDQRERYWIERAREYLDRNKSPWIK